VQSPVRRLNYRRRMKRHSYFCSASVIAWLALFTSVFADSSTRPVQTREPPSARSSEQDSALVHERVVRPARRSSARKPAENALYLELLGPAVVFSLNYERVLVGQVGVRVGFSPLWGSTSDGQFDFAVPITIAYVGWHGLEAGGGITLLTDRAPIATTLIGYRLHPRGGAGFQFRAGGMLLAGNEIWRHVGSVMPWLYLSAGVGF
jgi:hypothetical protein